MSLPIERENAESPPSLVTTRSSTYDKFPVPINPTKNGFDFHIYYMQEVTSQKEYAKELYKRIKKEFPELMVYYFWEKPVGPHPTAMFEVDTRTPHQTGALFVWLTVNRGPCSVLIHPNTDDPYKDHTELMTWMGTPWPLHTEMLKEH